MAEADVMPIEARGDERLLSRAGEKLRAARERLGIDRGELSIRTKINERHLAAVEDSDFSSLPARIYAVGFARSYAGAVGLDAGVIAAQVRRELNEQEMPATARPAYDQELEDPAKVPSRRLAWIAAAAGIALIATGAVFWRSYFVPAVDLPPVRNDVVANAAVTPELSPAAMISPTAESAAGQLTPVDPVPAAIPALTAVRPSAQPRPSQRNAVPVAAPSSHAQSLPSRIPDRLEPAGVTPTQSETLPVAPAT